MELTQRYPLPEGQRDEILNRREIAMAFDVSENTITKWVTQGFPVKSEGSNGQAYEFQLSECHAWYMHRDAEETRHRAEALESAAQYRMRLRNMDDDDSANRPTMSAKERAEEAVADLREAEARERRGELMRTEKVRAALQTMLSELRLSFDTIPDFAEREFNMPPDQVERLEQRCNGAAEEFHRRITELMQPPSDVHYHRPRQQGAFDL